MKNMTEYFSKTERWLWGISTLVILISFFLFDRDSYLTLFASLLGVTSLIYNAKGNPLGQFLMVIFSLLYGFISYRAAYYGEMITYVGMTGPMAFFSLIAWMRHTVKGDKSQVEIKQLKKAEIGIMLILTIIVTIVFYYILKHFHTANLLLSTVSVTTSFMAVYMTFLRSAYYAVAYAANDVVLIVLWALMIPYGTSSISVMLCFVAFLFNDVYGFINWKRLYKRQQERKKDDSNV